VLKIGERFGNYELLERLNAGGSDIVYRARELSLGRPVALRLIPPQVAPDATARARLNREVTVLAALDQPNVAPIYEVGEHDGMLFVATRWIDGLPLQNLVEKDGPLSPRRAVRMVGQVAAALEVAHAHGIAHRAVRPSSVLVTSTDFVYLTDFGLARRSGDITGLTVQEQLLGQSDYVAPEYIAGQEAGRPADIYGLGGVLYFALTGEVPFPAPNSSAKLYAHTSTPPPAPSRLRPDTPPGLDAVVQRALSKSPDDRQPSAAEFAFEASGAVGLSSPPWVAITPPGPVPERPGEPARAPDAPARAPAAPADEREARSLPASGTSPQSNDGFSERVIYGRHKRVNGRLVGWALGLVLFAAAPVALLIAALH
jgi:serine/threonine protein kinase